MTNVMPISKQKKVEILATLDAGFHTAETVAFVNFYKLPGKDLTQLRKELRDAGVTLYVAKKTLVKHALDAKKVTGTQPEMKGELALAWGTDPIAPAKGVFEFIKTHKDQMSLMGGVYQGAYMSKEEITQLAAILGRDQLLSKFVGMLNESIARVVRVVNERAASLGGPAPVAETAPEGEVAAPEVPADVVPAVA
jgi:large subunit ribosomal protein L10